LVLKTYPVAGARAMLVGVRRAEIPAFMENPEQRAASPGKRWLGANMAGKLTFVIHNFVHTDDCLVLSLQ
jgi:hypothetical protein